MKDEIYDFDDESPEDIEAYLDAIIETYGFDRTPDDGTYVSITDIDRVIDIAEVCKVLKHLTKGSKNVTVTYELNMPFDCMGSVTIRGKSVKFNNPDVFMKAVKISDNFEAYPKADGTVEMNFTFHNVTRSVE